jgi:tetratricopeptide (TPR) repeat protein
MDKQFALGKQTHDVGGMAGDLVFMGNILLEQGNADAALARFNEASALVAKSSLAKEVKENNAIIRLYNVARAAVSKNDMQTARTSIDRLRKISESKKNVNQIRLAHELEGMCALSSGEYRKAIEELLQSNLQNPYNLYRLAHAYLSAGDKEKGTGTLKEAARFNGLPALNYAFIRAKAEKELSAL